MCGRFFNAFGEPIDGGPAVDGEEREIGGPSVNPVRRKQPSELIATGIAGIDLNNTLVSGSKNTVFCQTLTSPIIRSWPMLLYVLRPIVLFWEVWA